MFGNNGSHKGVGDALNNAVGAAAAGVASYSISKGITEHLEEMDAKKAEHESRMREMKARRDAPKPNAYKFHGRNPEPVTAEAMNKAIDGLPGVYGKMFGGNVGKFLSESDKPRQSLEEFGKSFE